MIAGSSGGHILPAIKYLNNLANLKAPNEILFITNEIGKSYLKNIKKDKINKIVLSSKNKLSYILNVFLKTSSIFLFNRRMTLIGFGGFITTPILLISKLFNIFFFSFNNIYAHEQNIIYGLANKINYFFVKNIFISFPRSKMRSKEIFVGNSFLNKNVSREILDNKFINILLLGGSGGSLDLNNKMLEELKILEKKNKEKIKIYIQIPKFYQEILQKKYTDLLDNKKCIFFSFKNNLNFKEFDFILSRSGSGSINEILYYTNNVYFMPHLISRDQHQKFNLNYFLSHNMSLKKFIIPNNKKLVSQFYFNSIINPYSIEKMICYTTR